MVDCRVRVSSYTLANSMVFSATALVYSLFLQRLSAYSVRRSEYRISVFWSQWPLDGLSGGVSLFEHIYGLRGVSLLRLVSRDLVWAPNFLAVGEFNWM